MLIVAVLLGLLSWRPRYGLSSEPTVVWKSDEPLLLRDALRAVVFDGLKVEFPNAGAANPSGNAVACADLAESWFRPAANPPADGSAPGQGVPLACDWVPGEPEVVVINR